MKEFNELLKEIPQQLKQTNEKHSKCNYQSDGVRQGHGKNQ